MGWLRKGGLTRTCLRVVYGFFSFFHPSVFTCTLQNFCIFMLCCRTRPPDVAQPGFAPATWNSGGNNAQEAQEKGGCQVCSAPRVISCLRLKKREQAACGTTWVTFLTLKSEGDNTDLCRSLDGQEPSDAADA